MQRILVLTLLLLSSCVPKAHTPIQSAFLGQEVKNPEEVILLLPGRGNKFDAYAQQPFLEDLNKYFPNRQRIQFISVDAHLGYYYERSLLPRVKEDILARYPQAQVSVIGVSLGGLGALLLLKELPEERLKDVLAISPWLGEVETIDKVNAVPPPDHENLNPTERMLEGLWKMLREADWNKSMNVQVACGDRDYHRPQMRKLEHYAPKVEVKWYPGAHKWVDWRPIWQEWMRSRSRGEATKKAVSE